MLSCKTVQKMTSALFCLLALVALCGRGVESNEGLEERWHEIYERLFWTVPLDDKDSSPNVDVDELKHDLTALNDMLKASTNLRGSLPDNQIKVVEFWSQVDRFRPNQCSVAREIDLGAQYDRALPLDPPSMIPNLMMLRDSARQELLEYCVRMQSKTVLKYIDEIPSGDMSLLVSSFKEEDDINFGSVARFLAPYLDQPAETGEKFPQLAVKTKRVYEEQLKGSCDSIISLPKESQDVILYAKHTGALNRFDSALKNWIIARKLCRYVSDFQDVLVHHIPQAVEDYYEARRRKKSGLKKILGCFGIACTQM